MLKSLVNFDPIQYLEIDKSSFSNTQLAVIRKGLQTYIGQYVLLKLSGLLTDQQIKQISKTNNGAEILTLIRNSIPNADKKILIEVANFKKGYEGMVKNV